ncbi:hypothetical protein SS50377_21092 [Spironucleus salmonicida]|uniref:Uncharacterized protein n=1 Tax=Spironucleus salmonicida TaxID=348837 RepID=A0A9P8M2K1_9EUKA|nr:hypothetical protein SS50377_21092 [Spironucleus salmonicida]
MSKLLNQQMLNNHITIQSNKLIAGLLVTYNDIFATLINVTAEDKQYQKVLVPIGQISAIYQK